MGSRWPDGPAPLGCNGPRRPQAGAGRPLQERYSSRSRWPGAARSKPHASPHRRRDEPPRPIGRTARQPQPTRPGSRRGSRRASLGQPGALRTGGCVRPPGHRAGGVGWRRGTPCRRLNEHRGGIYATWLEDAGIPARVIDELMGHEATSRGGQQRGSAMGPTTGTPREMAARLATAIQQGLTVVLEVAEQVLEAPDPSQFGPRRLLIPLVGLLIGVLPILGYTLQFGAKTTRRSL
jgi:hypothetical protein